MSWRIICFPSFTEIFSLSILLVLLIFLRRWPLIEFTNVKKVIVSCNKIILQRLTATGVMVVVWKGSSIRPNKISLVSSINISCILWKATSVVFSERKTTLASNRCCNCTELWMSIDRFRLIRLYRKSHTVFAYVGRSPWSSSINWAGFEGFLWRSPSVRMLHSCWASLRNSQLHSAQWWWRCLSSLHGVLLYLRVLNSCTR